ncbi:hypothetical protein GOP47_0002003 [Adiantum capillus-veneris]|uniref:Uncharacterized protein n=2 Tax=Adiantum capillus-veneris TaxID=13818 RepID=A0A9D4V9B9_ADICA|nr:hypothetical protein GOP47_0002003 [Adiantum capillus-veneris]
MKPPTTLRWAGRLQSACKSCNEDYNVRKAAAGVTVVHGAERESSEQKTDTWNPVVRTCSFHVSRFLQKEMISNRVDNTNQS